MFWFVRFEFSSSQNGVKYYLELILESISTVGLNLYKDIVLSLDVASTEFFENKVNKLG